MHTEILSSSSLEKAISSLKEGVPVAFPTETVYGLGAPAHDPAAIQKIFMIKGRPADNPLIVHVLDVEQGALLGEDLPPLFFLLAKAFWPGPLTLVVKKNSSVPSIVSGGLSSIAIRCPSHTIAQRLIESVGPIAAPSANLSGSPSPTSAEDVFEDLQGRIPWIIDGGSSLIGIESTVVSLLDETPILLRPGTITKQMLEEVIQSPIAMATDKTPHHSPGMKYRHYAPKAALRLVYDRKDLKGEYVLSMNPSPGERLLNEKTLYAELRRADRENVSEIEIDCCPLLCSHAALMNRIHKAAGEVHKHEQ